MGFKRKSKYKSVDIGQFLYDHVHSLHHKSYNPGPWSGLSMHPIEHLFYYSCVWFPALFIPQHPIHFMGNKFHATISPAPGHDGYDSPIGGGAGGYFHYLHHAHYECNYGTDQFHWIGYLEHFKMARNLERINEHLYFETIFFLSYTLLLLQFIHTQYQLRIVCQ